jgi:hypothetical protein
MWRKKDEGMLVTCHWERAKKLSLLFLDLEYRPSGGAQFEGI